MKMFSGQAFFIRITNKALDTDFRFSFFIKTKQRISEAIGRILK